MEATLQEILDAREWRAKRQQQLLEKYHKPLLCFTMNIPGPEKWNRDVSVGFAVGNLLLRERLHGVLHHERKCDNGGCAAFYVVDMPAKQLKKIALDIERTDQIGRLFDMDVLDISGEKISRETLGYRPRKCLICQEDARVCGRTRAHGLEILQRKIQELLHEATYWLADYIAATAYLALIQEVNTTPKPGLVDRNNNGSHKDMSLRHFFSSSNALRPYFYQFAETGLNTYRFSPKITLEKIRQIGKEAEDAMFQATGGVNTHKGAIFSMGLICAAAGRIPPENWNTADLLEECAAMAAGIVAEDFKNTTIDNAKTNGELLYANFGITGIRGQAEAGFPMVREIALPAYRNALHHGCNKNHAGCITLLHLIANVDDTNLIHRSSKTQQLEIMQQIEGLLEKDPFPSLETIFELDQQFIKKNLSPGGSADLLAMAYFLQILEGAK